MGHISNNSNLNILEYVDEHPFPHFQFIGWPDHGAPKSTDSIIALAKEVRKIVSETKDNVKVLVHCAAGVGRTGTFIALYHLMEELDEKVVQYLTEDEPSTSSGNEDDDIDNKITIDVFQTVFNLRKKRCEMVKYSKSMDSIFASTGLNYKKYII